VTATVGYAKRKEKPMIRKFESGATRDTEEGKLDYEGFLSPLVLERYAQFMHLNRTQKDGAVRASDNWQKGIPQDTYMKSMWRHFMAVWKHHRKIGDEEDFETALCALTFNAMGMLHEVLEGKRRPEPYTPALKPKETPYRPGHDDPLGVGPCECEPRRFHEPPALPPHEREIEKLKEMQRWADTISAAVPPPPRERNPNPYATPKQDAMDSTTRCPLCFERSGFHTGFCPTNKEVVK
jgi:hypothetical protein